MSVMSIETASIMFDTPDVIKVDGILNIGATYGGTLISIYLFFWWLNYLVKIPFPLGNMSRVLLLIALIITPLLAMGTYTKIHSNLTGYVECKSERKFSLRYSSRTFAIDESLCPELSKTKVL
jgi:hypothetical protein